jgi:hypothetical protein
MPPLCPPGALTMASPVSGPNTTLTKIMAKNAIHDMYRPIARSAAFGLSRRVSIDASATSNSLLLLVADGFDIVTIWILYESTIIT